MSLRTLADDELMSRLFENRIDLEQFAYRGGNIELDHLLYKIQEWHQTKVAELTEKTRVINNWIVQIQMRQRQNIEQWPAIPAMVDVDSVILSSPSLSPVSSGDVWLPNVNETNGDAPPPSSPTSAVNGDDPDQRLPSEDVAEALQTMPVTGPEWVTNGRPELMPDLERQIDQSDVAPSPPTL